MDDPYYVRSLEELAACDIPLHMLHAHRFFWYAHTVLHNTIRLYSGLDAPMPKERMRRDNAAVLGFVEKTRLYLVLLWPALGDRYGVGEQRLMAPGTPAFLAMMTALLAQHILTEGRNTQPKLCLSQHAWARNAGICMHGTPVSSWTCGQVLRTWELLAARIETMDPADHSIWHFVWELLVRTSIVCSEPARPPYNPAHVAELADGSASYPNDAWVYKIMLYWVSVETPLFLWRRVVQPMVQPEERKHARIAELVDALQIPSPPAYDDIVDAVLTTTRAKARHNRNMALHKCVMDRVRADFIPSWFYQSFSVLRHFIAPDHVRELEKYWHHAIALEFVSTDLPKHSMLELFQGANLASHAPQLCIPPTCYMLQQILLEQSATAVPWFDHCVLYGNSAVDALLPAVLFEDDHARGNFPVNNMHQWACDDVLQTLDHETLSTCDFAHPDTLWRTPVIGRGSMPVVVRLMDRLYVYHDARMWEINRSTWQHAFADAFCFFLMTVYENGVYEERTVTYNMSFIARSMSELLRRDAPDDVSEDEVFVSI